MAPAAGEHRAEPRTAPAFPVPFLWPLKVISKPIKAVMHLDREIPVLAAGPLKVVFPLLIRTENHCFLLFGGIRCISRNHPTVLLETSILYLFFKMRVCTSFTAIKTFHIYLVVVVEIISAYPKLSKHARALYRDFPGV